MASLILPAFVTNLWLHRQLLWQFTQRQVELRHRGSHLGLAWSFLNPLLTLTLYVFVFGYIFGGSFGILPNETTVDYALAVFLGLAIFHFGSEVMGSSSGIIVGNPNFVKKVVFPLEILPAANTAAALVHLVITLGLVMISLFLFGHNPTRGLLWLPVILLPVALLFLGISWFFSSVGVFFRDLNQIIQFCSMGLLFSSAVFYPISKIPPPAWAILKFNPLLLAIELARDAVLWHKPLNLLHLGYLYVTGFTVCYLSHLIFVRLKPTFSDEL